MVIGLCDCIVSSLHINAPFLLATSGGKSIPGCSCELEAWPPQQGPDRQVLVGFDKLEMVAGEITSYTGTR